MARRAESAFFLLAQIFGFGTPPARFCRRALANGRGTVLYRNFIMTYISRPKLTRKPRAMGCLRTPLQLVRNISGGKLTNRRCHFNGK